MNFHEQEDEEATTNDLAAPFIKKHLHAKSRVLTKKSTYQSVLEEIDRRRKIGVEELRRIIGPQQVSQFKPLLSKFETLSKRDEEAIAEDEELL